MTLPETLVIGSDGHVGDHNELHDDVNTLVDLTSHFTRTDGTHVQMTDVLTIANELRVTYPTQGPFIVGRLAADTRYTAVGLAGDISTTNHHFSSLSSAPDLTINRPVGYAIDFREGNGRRVMQPSALDGFTFGAASDTNLYRFSANYLKTDDSLMVGSELIVDHNNLGSKLYFGPAVDTNLYRFAANLLKTDDAFHAVGIASVGSSIQALALALPTTQAFGAGIVGESTNRMNIEASGSISWGGGSGFDTNLYRSAANVLKTDDAFVSATNVSAPYMQVTGGYYLNTDTGVGNAVKFGSTTDTNLYRSAANTLKTDDDFNALNINAGASVTAGGATALGAADFITQASATDRIRFVATSGEQYLQTDDLFTISPVAAGTQRFTVDTAGNIAQPQVGTYHQFTENGTTDAAAGAANTARLYCKDNGAGKTQLCVRFNTGAVQVLATEP